MKKFNCLLVLFVTLSIPQSFAKPPVALAKIYQPETYPDIVNNYWMSEKYDGVRALWDGKQLRSRNGNLFAAPAWFVAGLPKQKLDGELWLGHGKFQQTVSIVRRQRPHKGWKNIRYLVFDLPAEVGAFKQRYAELKLLQKSSKNMYWKPVIQHPISSLETMQKFYTDVLDKGGEGIILRSINSLHKVGRNDDLLKYKPFIDADARVIGYNPGKGKYQGLIGSLRVKTTAGIEFNIGSGLSDAQRRQPPPLGSIISYRYQGFTNSGKPRFPVFLRLRQMKDDEYR